MSTTAWLRFLDNTFDEAIRKIEQELGQGAATDYADYKSRVGEIRGLSRGRTIVRDSLRQYFEEVDEDDP